MTIDALWAAALAFDGLPWLVATAFVAGIVRGFAGFGTALVFVPVAARFVDPVTAVTLLVALDLIGPLPNVPRAWREGARGDLVFLSAGLLIGLPAGIAVLSHVAPGVFRYGVSAISLAMLLLLASGVRYRGPPGRGLILTTGGIAGLLGGVAGIPGPPVILLYMASERGIAAIRATILLFLVICDLALLGLLGAVGRLAGEVLLFGFALSLPNLFGNMLGAAAFRPDRARLYRGVAYGIIAISALSGLPVWG